MLSGRTVRIPLLGFGGTSACTQSLFRVRTPSSKDDKLERSVSKGVPGCQTAAHQSPQQCLISRMLTAVPLDRFHHPCHHLSRAEFYLPDKGPSAEWTTPFEWNLQVSPFTH